MKVLAPLSALLSVATRPRIATLRSVGSRLAIAPLTAIASLIAIASLFAIASLIVIASLLAAGPARAGNPDPVCSRCTLDGTDRLLLVPANSPASPLGTFTVIIKDIDCVPLRHIWVEVLVGGMADSKVALCGSTVTTGYTDDTGTITFNIPGGGCYKGHTGVVIRANGFIIREYNAVMSPDYAAIDNAGAPGMWDLHVGLNDLSAFASAMGSGVASCHDYDNNGATNVADFAVFARAWSDAAVGCR